MKIFKIKILLNIDIWTLIMNEHQIILFINSCNREIKLHYNIVNLMILLNS